MTAQYSSVYRDARFILEEWLPVDEVLAYSRYHGFYSKEDIKMLFEQFNRVVKDVLAPTNDDGEDNLPRLEAGRIIGPPSWKEAFRFFQSNGWGTSNFDENGEGTLPEVVYCMLVEMACAASPSFIYYPALTTGAAKLIQRFASSEVKARFLPGMMDGSFQGCMCITEPQAGSDVGESMTRAYPTEEEGIYKIKGSKIFISAGDGDHADNFIYLTLARTVGARGGTRGLSLFVVPRFWINDDGTIEDNDVATVSKEHKFGIRGCPTVTLAFGDNDNCRGYVVGEGPDQDGNGQGMMQMFEMMNGKRLESGLTSAGIAANEYWNAALYCQERVQGRPFVNPRGERVPIIQHEDIKRALVLNKATTEACRALIAKAYYYLDVSENDPDPARRKWADNRLACLTPVCKAYPSDEAWNLLCETIQIYGGYGFTEEYPAARAVRDVKINSIYEGTNYIQSIDLVGRKWSLDGGKTFAGLLSEIEQFIADNRSENEGLLSEFNKLEKGLLAYRQIQANAARFLADNQVSLLPVYSRRILTATGQLLGAGCLLEHAVVAARHLSSLDKGHPDYYYYFGKIISARYYINNVLPQVWLLADIMAEPDSSVLDAVPEIFAF